MYDWTYRDPSALAGWRATATGQPLPAEHMTDWADRTVELVLAAGPRRVLELGCGTGMLLDRLYPHLDAYVGTDIAADIVERLSARALPGVTVVRAAAHEIDGAAVRAALDDVAPDCVLLNSVTQCFPDAAYLTTAVRAAVAVVAPGGTVVVGDVRHAGLHRRHCRELENGDVARAAERAAADPELLLDPQTIATAALAAGRDVRIAVHAKALRADTELSRYRFDAVLQVEQGPVPEPEVAAWDGDPLAGTSPVLLRSIPNALLTPGPDAATAAALRDALDGTDAAVLVDETDPALLVVARPALAGTMAATTLAGSGRSHEPLPAFVRGRIAGIVRRQARQAGRNSTDVTVHLPAGRYPAEAAPAHAAGLAALADPAAAIDGDALPTAMRTLDDIAVAAMARTLAALVPGDGPVAARHAWILRRWRETLAAHGEPAHGGDLDGACATLGYPPAMATFFRAAIAELPRLLRDEIDLQALLFPDGEILTALGTYQDDVINTYLNGALTHLAARMVATRPVPLRVLELGAGVGGSTAAVLAGIDAAPADYLFTDVSRFFTTAAAQRFTEQRFAGLRYGLLDINRGLATHPERHDLVVAANVLHNAADVGAVLRQVHDVLEPGGVLALVESTREHYQALTSMMFLMSPRDGEPHPGHADVRAGTDRIFLTEHQWWAELARAGLRPVYGLPEEGPLTSLGQRLLVATR